MPPKFRRPSDDEVGLLNDPEKEQLLGSDDEEEDFFLRGPTAPKLGSINAKGQPDRLQQVKNEVKETTAVIQSNVERLIERGDRLETLQIRSEELLSSSDAFENSARRLKRKAWWQHTRTKAALIVLAIILFVIILAPVLSHWS